MNLLAYKFDTKTAGEYALQFVASTHWRNKFALLLFWKIANSNILVAFFFIIFKPSLFQLKIGTLLKFFKFEILFVHNQRRKY